MQDSLTQTKLSLGALYTLSRNGLINHLLINRHVSLANRKLLMGSTIIEHIYIQLRNVNFLAIAIITFGIAGILIECPQYAIIGTFLSCTLGAFVIIHGRHSVSPLASDLKKLHSDGFNGYYRLHWEVKDMCERAEVILQNRGSTLRRREDELGLEHPETKMVRKKFRKSHAIFLKFELCDKNPRQYIKKATPATQTA